MPPLIDAIEQGDWFKTKLLLQAGADPRAKNEFGETARTLMNQHPKLNSLTALADSAIQWHKFEALLQNPIAQWRQEKVQHPEFPFAQLCP